MEKETFTHESYGLLQISRFRGGDRTYFGSSIEHDCGVSLEVHEGELQHGLHSDWFHPTKKILEIRMTETQFAEAITHLNSSPIPVTIREVCGKRMEAPPAINRREQFESELDEQFVALEARIAKLSESTENLLSEKKNLTKADRETILKEISMIRQAVRSNLPYMRDSFREAMDDIVHEAKTEAESFIRQRAKSLGIDSAEMLSLPETSALETQK